MVRRRAAEARRFEPGPVRDLEAAGAPGIREVQRAVPRGAALDHGGEDAREARRTVGRQGAERREDERAELVRRLVLVQARAAQQGAELGAVRAATRQPGELFAQLQADDVDPLRQSGIAAKWQSRRAGVWCDDLCCSLYSTRCKSV